MVLEGKLDGVSLKPATELRLQPDKVERTLRAALSPEEVIREVDLERGLLLLNDLPGLTARSVISPGTTLGTSTITAEVSEGPLVTGSLDFDTHGNKYSGYYQGGRDTEPERPLGPWRLFHGTLCRNLRDLLWPAGLPDPAGSYRPSLGRRLLRDPLRAVLRLRCAGRRGRCADRHARPAISVCPRQGFQPLRQPGLRCQELLRRDDRRHHGRQENAAGYLGSEWR
jgi:hypothetical protein